MKPTPDQLAAGLRAAYVLGEHGPGDRKPPVSFVKDPQLYVEKIAEAVLPDWLSIETAPADSLGVIVHGLMTCCAQGRVVMVAARQGGVWIYPGDHCFEFLGWMPLPDLPEERHGLLS